MNTNRIKQQWVVILSSLTLLLTACNEHELPAPPAAGGKMLCFAVSEANTKMTYNGIRTSFEDNDTIGCIITVDGNYAANSAWHYNKESGMLILDYIWVTKYEWSNPERIPYDKNELISRKDDQEGITGFIDLQQEGPYSFYFYYPYVASDLLQKDVADAVSSYNADKSIPFYKYLTYPNIATNEGLTFTANYQNYDLNNANDQETYLKQYYLTGEARNIQYANAPYCKYREYPCFVNHTQTSKAQINNSDFLWVSREDIPKDYNQTVNLIFQKKMATVEVVSDTPLTDVYFQAKAAESLRRGKEINLSTGNLTDYTILPTEWNPTLFQKNRYFTADEHILPYDNSDGAGTDYRIVLPPQEAFPCNLTFTLQGTEHTIDLSTQINSLAEGTLYVIHINSRGESTLEIVDWQNEHYEILTPTDNNITTD